ncbi:MAG: ATP-dependent DNA helicase RecG, partial [Eubacteriales bacterium]|nr:ATP-dependent DNA helicase RecG [Eubacteriales bacterium]
MAVIKNPDSLRNIKGIGEKTEQLFEKVGVFGMRDLLYYFPRDYDFFTEPVKAGEVVAGKKNAVLGQVLRKPTVKTFGGNSITIVSLSDETGSLQINWFHMPFLRNTIKVGAWYVFRGLVIEKNGKRILEHPEMFSAAGYQALCGQALPVYGLTAGLTNNTIRKTVKLLLEKELNEKEFLPDRIRSEYRLGGLMESLRDIHYPENMDQLAQAVRRLSFDEFFLFLLGISFLKESAEQKENHFPMKPVSLTGSVIRSLPYALTGSQKQVWQEMERDLASPVLMSRLIQGDVGSGKTILAFLAMLMTAENGYQSALMVPTEVLAEQHFEALTELLEKNKIDYVHPVLLKGSCNAAERREIYASIESGESLMIVGTHALIQEKVMYHNLGLVITDEQHRFGVKQRMTLSTKGYTPNVLVMSATPIPRTLALILYGDLDISVLKDMPAERLPIKNCVVNTTYRPTAYSFMRKQITAGRQVYIICPMVEPNEEIRAENVTEYCEKMKQMFEPDIRVGMLHGQMKPKEKQEIMQAFAANEIQILVSTTVVEVGVNVPNASVMMVENAERFGLAQLHQLRGRVGRGRHQSYCIFMQGDKRTEISKRLEILNKSNDGFFIAEEDLKLRGPGDLFGTRQSGEAVFQVADIYRDKDLLAHANQAVHTLLQQDPRLETAENQGLKLRLESYLARQ